MEFCASVSVVAAGGEEIEGLLGFGLGEGSGGLSEMERFGRLL